MIGWVRGRGITSCHNMYHIVLYTMYNMLVPYMLHACTIYVMMSCQAVRVKVEAYCIIH